MNRREQVNDESLLGRSNELRARREERSSFRLIR